MKNVLSQATEDKIKAENKLNQLEKEHSYIKERINIFEK